jgi:hypothetical protein
MRGPLSPGLLLLALYGEPALMMPSAIGGPLRPVGVDGDEAVEGDGFSAGLGVGL